MKKLFIIVLMLITSLVPNKYDGDVSENELQNTNDEEIILSLENEIVPNEVIEQVEENHIVAQDTSKIIVQEEISIENNNSEKEEIVYQEDTQSYQEQPKIESQKEFPQEQELKDKIVRLEQVNKELNLNEKEHEIIDNDEPDEKSQERDFDKER